MALIGAATFLETFAGVLDGSAIVDHCLKEHSPERYARLFDKGASGWLASVEPGGAPIGFAILAPADLPNMIAGDIELKRIYALARFHGTGVGPAMLQRAIAAAKSGLAKRLLLGVYAGNSRAIAFYKKNGLSPIASRKFHVGGTDYDDIVLALDLP